MQIQKKFSFIISLCSDYLEFVHINNAMTIQAENAFFSLLKNSSKESTAAKKELPYL